MKLPHPGWCLVAIIGVAAVGKPPSIRWLNEETSKQEQFRRKDHAKYYGNKADMVIMPYTFNTNIVVDIGVGTNRFPIEFGFRDDGVVVWRRR